MPQDSIDDILDQWSDERPELDTAPLGIVIRVMTLYKAFSREATLALEPLGLELWEYDVLSTLRRQGEPYAMAATALAAATRLSTGAMTHRVDRLPKSRLDQLVVGGFGLSSLSFFRREGVAARRGEIERAPLWNDHALSAHTATPGLWAVEPHIGLRGVGAKWEELLVVTEHDAYWLDDDLPHVRLFGPALGYPRTATFALEVDGHAPSEVQSILGERGIYTWAGHYYALEVLRRLGRLDSGGLLRVGFLHYNTIEEVDRLLEVLEGLR